MDPDLLVSVLQPMPVTGGEPPAPLMLLVVDTRASGTARQVQGRTNTNPNSSTNPNPNPSPKPNPNPNQVAIELSEEQVYGWNPCTGDATAGFAECPQGVLGGSVRLSLSPGDGVLLRLTVWRPPVRARGRARHEARRGRLRRADHGADVY